MSDLLIGCGSPSHQPKDALPHFPRSDLIALFSGPVPSYSIPVTLFFHSDQYAKATSTWYSLTLHLLDQLLQLNAQLHFYVTEFPNFSPNLFDYPCHVNDDIHII